MKIITQDQAAELIGKSTTRKRTITPSFDCHECVDEDGNVFVIVMSAMSEAIMIPISSQDSLCNK